MQMQFNDALISLIDDVENIVAAGGGEQAVTTQVAASLELALADGLDLPAGFMAANPERYVMYPLYVAPDGAFSIAAAVWNVGQSTPIHDHQTWGVVGIHSGVEGEERFEPPEEGVAPVFVDTESWKPGQVTICCTTDRDLHRVTCASEIPCVGIHIYGADIGTLRRKAYDEATGDVRWFVSEWATPEG